MSRVKEKPPAATGGNRYKEISTGMGEKSTLYLNCSTNSQDFKIKKTLQELEALHARIRSNLRDMREHLFIIRVLLGDYSLAKNKPPTFQNGALGTNQPGAPGGIEK